MTKRGNISTDAGSGRGQCLSCLLHELSPVRTYEQEGLAIYLSNYSIEPLVLVD
jgi:hypothetical protein